jgi:hypothetical protein
MSAHSLKLIAMFLADPSAGELLLGTGSTGMAAVLFTGRINGQKFFQTPTGMFHAEQLRHTSRVRNRAARALEKSVAKGN